ncbi:MAG: Acryloyl-CoA reductase (NADH) [Phycisphaerae bacterium]|nr:Acryloyl-CoA reductase (NADH) [Phycisphaerae bacterium]
MLEYVHAEDRDLVLGARDFAREVLLEVDRRCDREESSICQQVLPKLAEMGFMNLLLPTVLGGLGCSYLTYAAIIHEISYASPSAAVTLCVHNMVGLMLHRFATPRVREELLPYWGRAENLGCFAISEAGAGSDPGASTTTAELRNQQWVINGSKMWITNGITGRWFVTLCQTRQLSDKKGLCMILVDGQQSGFDRLKISGKMGIRGSETVSLHLSNVIAPEDHLLDEPGTGLKVGLLALNGGRIGIAAQATGIATAALDDMNTYSQQRMQFGQPLNQFQAVQNLLADSMVELAAAQGLIARAAELHDRGELFTKEAAMAKLYASEMASRVTDRAVQIHGGSGYVNDYRAEQLYRDARVTRIYEGASEIMRLVIARELMKRT